MATVYVAENRILVKPVEASDRSEGGIYLTDAQKDDKRGSRKGTVVKAGTRRIESTGQRFDSQFEPGHLVVFSHYQGVDVKIEGVDYVVLREEDVLLALPSK